MPFVVGIYDARRKEGNGEYGTDDATDDLALSAESVIDAFERWVETYAILET